MCRDVVQKLLRRLRAGLKHALVHPRTTLDEARDGTAGSRARVPLPTVARLAELSSSPDKFVVFFAPDAGIIPHYITHCVVAKTLEDRGYKTLIVRCRNIYPRCVVMDGEVLPFELTAEQRRDVCARCRSCADEMTGAYDLTVVDLEEMVDDEIRRKVRGLMASLPDDLSSFEVEGVRLGKICGAEAAVTFKATDFTGATPEVRALLLRYLEGALLSYFAIGRLLQSGSVARLVHFNEYAIVLSAAFAARQRGIPTTFISLASMRGVDRRRVVFLSDSLAIVSYRNRLKEWPEWRNLSLSPNAVKDVVDDAIFRMTGGSIMVYSPTRSGATDEVFTRLRLSPERKLLVAFTSSLDEIGANQQYLAAVAYEPFSDIQPFEDQIEWLLALIEHVEKSKDLQLVVRVHPREGANRRENIVSNHLAKLRANFDRTFEHVRFVWPEDDISSYDLMEIADVGLSGWSSTSLEMSRMGVPAIIAFDKHTPLPIGDVVQWASTPEGYFKLIEAALQQLPSFDRIRFGFRWTHMRALGSSLDMGDVIPDPNCAVLPPFRSSEAGVDVERVLVGGDTTIAINLERMRSGQHAHAELEEREAFLTEMRRAIWTMCLGETAPADYKLAYSEGPSIELPAGCNAIVTVDGGFVDFRTTGKQVRRRSRMVQRLAFLSADASLQGAMSDAVRR
jgi:hypothetical protein